MNAHAGALLYSFYTHTHTHTHTPDRYKETGSLYEICRGNLFACPTLTNRFHPNLIYRKSKSSFLTQYYNIPCLYLIETNTKLHRRCPRPVELQPLSVSSFPFELINYLLTCLQTLNVVFFSSVLRVFSHVYHHHVSPQQIIKSICERIPNRNYLPIYSI